MQTKLKLTLTSHSSFHLISYHSSAFNYLFHFKSFFYSSCNLNNMTLQILQFNFNYNVDFRSWSVTSILRLNKTEVLINLHQVWLKYNSDMTQHSFSFSTLFSFINILFIYITFFSCHKHISFRPSAVSEHYINRSFCTNLLLYS